MYRTNIITQKIRHKTFNKNWRDRKNMLDFVVIEVILASECD